MSVVKRSHYQIFDWWKTKFISKDGKVKDRPERGAGDIPVVFDWAEPECWACGRRCVGAKKELEHAEYCKLPDGDFNFERMWSYKDITSGFERAHIIPEALGGSGEDPSNLFLLCPNCHALSPDTMNPENFFRWVYRRRHEYENGVKVPRLYMEMIAEEINLRGLNAEEIINEVNIKFDNTKPDELWSYLKENVGFHASKVAESSLVCGFADWLILKWRQKNEKSA